MSFYAEWILPPLIDLSMRSKRLRPYRERTAGAAEGRVLDIGIGSGLNLPFYARNAREIFGLDPSLPLLARAQSKASRTQTPVHLLEGSAERSPGLHRFSSHRATRGGPRLVGARPGSERPAGKTGRVHRP